MRQQLNTAVGLDSLLESIRALELIDKGKPYGLKMVCKLAYSPIGRFVLKDLSL